MHLPSRWQRSAAIVVLLLVQSKDVLTVAIRDLKGRTLLGVGDSERLAEFPDTERGDSWTDSGLLLAESFDLQPAGARARKGGTRKRWQVKPAQMAAGLSQVRVAANRN